METREIERLRLKLRAFLSDLVVPMGRKERRQHAEEYIRGLLMDGERKSIEPMAKRLPDGDVQALQQFVNQSPWPWEKVRAPLARKVEQEFACEAYWLIDEVSFPKQGKHSVGVARQYCGALGKTANCQVTVTLDFGTEDSSVPLDWALYLPEEWINDPVRRKKTGIPEEVTFKTKWELALDLIDEVRGWGLQNRTVLADSLYGDTYEFRQGLRERGLDYIVQVSGELTAWTEDPHPSEPPMKRGGRIPRKRFYAKDFPPPRTLCQIAKELPSRSWKTITWREGTKGPLTSRFARVVVWVANGLVQGKTMRQFREELLIEWPEGDNEPWKYWLSSFSPDRISFRGLVRRAKARFRVEQDYEEMKSELGLDHFEGRSWQGFHHHVTLVAMAYAFLMLERMGNKKNFWIDLASCPPVDAEVLASVHGHMSDMWNGDL
ncbi:MAG: IS701 family transposase [Bacteroidota bacterium]